MSSIIKDSITETPKNVKKSNKSSQKDFLDDIFADNPGTKKLQKNEKKIKKSTSGAYVGISGLNCVKMDPK